MNTADLINQLAAETRLAPRRKPGAMLAYGVLAGAVVTLGATLLAFGVQSHLAELDRLAPFLMKLAFVSALGIPAFVVADGLARPGTRPIDLIRLVAVPTLILATLAIAQLLNASPANWPAMVLGGSWRECTLRIVILSLPILAGLFAALRKQAPVHLRRAGAVAGLLAGAMAAAIYALACTEASAAFVLLWYSGGVAMTTALGALLGPVALRW
jgi:hypothetical protein